MFISAGYSWRSRQTCNLASHRSSRCRCSMRTGWRRSRRSPRRPTNLTNSHISYSYGGGVRVGRDLERGAESSASPWPAPHRCGCPSSANTRACSPNRAASTFRPMSRSARPGMSTPNWTLMLDYKHIFYSDVPSVGNSTTFAGMPVRRQQGTGLWLERCRCHFLRRGLACRPDLDAARGLRPQYQSGRLRRM